MQTVFNYVISILRTLRWKNKWTGHSWSRWNDATTVLLNDAS